MNFISILYHEKIYDSLFTKLKAWFGSSVNQVQVYELVPDEYVRLEWTHSKDPAELASVLTEAFPDIVIEIPSTTGIDLTSRYFNNAQLW